MANQFYDERIPLPRFSLDYVNQERKVALTHRNIQVEGKNRSLLFLHIKSLNLENMRFSFNLQDNDVHANFCFIRYAYNAARTKVENYIVQKAVTQIFEKGNYSSSLDRFIELLNRNIDNYVNMAKASLGTRILYGHFAISPADNKLQYIYKFERKGINNQISVLAFNIVFVDLILKYFDTHYIKKVGDEFYYIRPAFLIDDIDNDFADMPRERTVTAYRDTTEFFFPTKKLEINIINRDSDNFAPGTPGYVTNAIPFNLAKSRLEINKYILLADKITSQLPVSYKLFVNGVNDNNVRITADAEYVVLKDEFDQFNMFKLHVGYIYNEDEYRELSYRKLMGITAKTVYLQNASSTELLTKLLARIFMHLPDIGGNVDASLWQGIRNIVGDRETLEDIYRLLYHAYPYEPIGPQTKRIKIDF